MLTSKDNIVLIGGGGHCASVIDVIELQNMYSIVGIVDLKEKIGERNLGYEFIGCDDDIPKLAKDYKNFIITIGHLKNPIRRIEIFTLLMKLSINLPVIVSPLAYVSKHTSIGHGSIIMHMAQVNTNAIIGSNCIINSRALIEHDVCIGDHCHISTGAIVNGGTAIGEKSFIGSGSVCREYINILPGSFIKANSLVK